MGTEAQPLGEVGMEEIIQAETEVVGAASAEKTASGEGSADEEDKGGTAPVDQEVTFYNVDDVPEELRPTFKEMKKAFTQKTQKLAADVKQAESSQYHAKLFRELMGDQRVVTFLEGLETTGGGGVGPQREGQASRGYSSEDSEVDPQVAELRRQVQQLQASMNQTQQKMQLSDDTSAFVASHPDWKKLQDGMEKAWDEDKRRSHTDAYNWAFRQSYLAKKAALERQRSRAQAGVERPGSTAETTKMHKIGSFNDAARAALDELGISRATFGV